MNLVLPQHGALRKAQLEFGSSLDDRELMEFSEQNPGFSVEWYATEGFIVMSPSGFDASRVSVRILRQIDDWAMARGDGSVADSSAGFRMSDGSVLSPDVSWVSSKRLAALAPSQLASYPPLCPELVVEVKSPSDSLAGLRKKCRRWIGEGARAVVLVNPESRTVELFLADNRHRTTGAAKLPIPGFEGLTLDIAAVWGTRTERR